MDVDVKPITHLYPVGNPDDLIIIYFKFPIVKSSKGKEVNDMRSCVLLELVREPIGHLLSKRRIALYLELYYPNLIITSQLVNRCYHVFKLVCQKTTQYECINEGSLDFSFESYYINPNTFTITRNVILKNLFSTSNPSFALCDIGYRINTHLEKDEKGEYIRHDCDLMKILLYEETYNYFVKIWSSFPHLQAIYDALRLKLPSDVCKIILKHSTFGKKDYSEYPEKDPLVELDLLEKDDEWLFRL
jgi:hypothetical protein